MPRKYPDIDRMAWFLVRRYGDDSAKVAYSRQQRCAERNDEAGAGTWKLVVRKIAELHFAPPRGPLH